MPRHAHYSYTQAHVAVLTLENIKAAFHTTGVIPFNPNVVTEAIMAPSLETLIHTVVPFQSFQQAPSGISPI